VTPRPPSPADRDAAVLAPREEEALAQAVRPVGPRGRGATVAAVLIVLAFVVGLVRPWDFLAGVSARRGPASDGPAAVARGNPTPGEASEDPGGPLGSVDDAAETAPTCGYPQSWRSATLQLWAGHRARVWSAAEAAVAARPDDPSIEFNVVAGEDFTAIGWCAPVSGPDRPPVSARGSLFRIDEDGTASQQSYARLEPPAATSLGELWVPAGQGASAAPAWPVGRYVIGLATADGSWSRWLGLELRSVPSEPARPAVSPVPSASPGASG
jgi:hypothetical protein